MKPSVLLYEETLQEFVKEDTRWLDLGCGHQILPQWRREKQSSLVAKCRRLVGIDYDMHSLMRNVCISLKVRGDITNLSFKDNCFNLVSSNMVVEHLDKPLAQLKEIYTILEPGGIFIFHTPNIFGYTTVISRLIPEVLKAPIISFIQGRHEEDVFPTFYRMNTIRNIRKSSAKTGFKVKRIMVVNSAAQFVMIPPLVFLELCWIRLLMTPAFRRFRVHIIAVLQKI